jgi:DNA-binding transcriptional regulator YdaS (Cro superfamily)
MKKVIDITQIQLAKRLGVHWVYLNAVLKGRVKASVLLALRIEKESGGKWKAVDLRPDIRPYL